MRRSALLILSYVSVVFILMTGCGTSAREEAPPPVTEDPSPIPPGTGNDPVETLDAGGSQQVLVEESEGHHFNCLTKTGNNAVIGIPNTISVSDPVKLEAGDELAVFSPEGSFCVGSVIWDGRSQAITAWGDDAQTGAIDGLQEGQEFQFRLWDQSEAAEYISVTTTYEIGDGIYQVDGIYVLQHLEFDDS